MVRLGQVGLEPMDATQVNFAARHHVEEHRKASWRARRTDAFE
jgi:hypothetical protein